MGVLSMKNNNDSPAYLPETDVSETRRPLFFPPPMFPPLALNPGISPPSQRRGEEGARLSLATMRLHVPMDTSCLFLCVMKLKRKTAFDLHF